MYTQIFSLHAFVIQALVQASSQIREESLQQTETTALEKVGSRRVGAMVYTPVLLPINSRSGHYQLVPKPVMCNDYASVIL